MDNSEVFIEKYKRLEKSAVAQYGFPSDGRAVYNLERMPRYRNVRSLLSYCREIRNLLQHNPKVMGEDAVQPSSKLIEFLDEMIRRVERPEKCISHAIKMKNLYFMKTGDKIYPAMEIMNKRHYSHVPILEDGRITGVFSRNVAFMLMMDGKTESDLKNMTFGEISDYTGFNKNRSETYVFIKTDTLIEEAELMCEDYYKSGRRIGLFFLTQNGNPSERIDGAITPWTILGLKY